MTSQYTIVGAGAIGGTLAVHLHLAGADVHLVDADPEHVAAIREHGLRIEHPTGELHHHELSQTRGVSLFLIVRPPAAA